MQHATKDGEGSQAEEQRSLPEAQEKTILLCRLTMKANEKERTMKNRAKDDEELNYGPSDRRGSQQMTKSSSNENASNKETSKTYVKRRETA